MMKFTHTNKHSGATYTLEFEDDFNVELVIVHFQDFIKSTTGHNLVMDYELGCPHDFDDDPVKPKRKMKMKK